MVMRANLRKRSTNGVLIACLMTVSGVVPGHQETNAELSLSKRCLRSDGDGESSPVSPVSQLGSRRVSIARSHSYVAHLSYHGTSSSAKNTAPPAPAIMS